MNGQHDDLPLIDRIVAEVSQRLPANLSAVRGEVERNLQAVLGEAISRLDLVSREEFDIQQRVLERSREKLEALEKQVAELERHGR